MTILSAEITIEASFATVPLREPYEQGKLVVVAEQARVIEGQAAVIAQLTAQVETLTRPGGGVDAAAGAEPGELLAAGGGRDEAEPAGMIIRQVRDVPLVKVRATEQRITTGPAAAAR